jgi:hypothetical protein
LYHHGSRNNFYRGNIRLEIFTKRLLVLARCTVSFALHCGFTSECRNVAVNPFSRKGDPMSPKTLLNSAPLNGTRSHVFFTHLQLQMFSVTQVYAPIMEKLLMEYSAIAQMEIAYSDAVDKARVGVIMADVGLNNFCDKVSSTVLAIVAGDRTHPLYGLLFEKKSVSVFKRPILGSQLHAMRKWPLIFETSDLTALSMLGPELVMLLAMADAALEAKAMAEQKNKLFREVGERRRFIDKVNAARKSLYGELSTLPHKVTGLPSGFADQFFRRDKNDRNDAEPTIEEVQAHIDMLAKELTAQQALLKQLRAGAAAEALPA